MKIKKKSKLSTTLSLGLIQPIMVEDPQKNGEHILGLVKKMLRQKKKPQVIVLPEMCLGAPTDRHHRDSWVLIYREWLHLLQAIAKKEGVAFYFSGFEKSRGHFYNSAYFIQADGKAQKPYRKIHLFSLGGERRIFSEGSISQIHSWKNKLNGDYWGGVICYDLRFPELFRRLVIKQKAKIVFVCAQWPENRREHWLTLLRARAIENQCFVVGVNRLGKKRELVFSGDSCVFDPWGEKLAHLDARQTTFIVNLNTQKLDEVRRHYPFLSEKKL